MAEFLIKAQDATNPDPKTDASGCYKRGDIVVAMPDGHQWGKAEGLPKFVVVKIPGVSVEAAKKYIESHTDDSDPANVVTLIRRKYRIRVDDVPAAILSQLRDTGQVTVTWKQIKTYVQNKITGLDES